MPEDTQDQAPVPATPGTPETSKVDTPYLQPPQPSPIPMPPVATGQTPPPPAVPVTMPQPPISVPMTQSKNPKKKLLLFIGAGVAAILAISGGYVFGFYLPNTPENVYSASLVNTGKGLDKLIDYSKLQSQAGYKSATFDGSMNVKSSSASFDMSLNGSADKDANATVSLHADIMGEKATANIRSISAKGSTSPDLYIQVNGVKSYLDANGMNALDSLDGQWVSIDHTLLDTYASSLKQQLGSTSQSELAAAGSVPTYAQVQDALAKSQAVNKQYVFTTNSAKAVLTGQKYLGQEVQGGRKLDHYKVGYNKTNLEAYVTALGTALDGSQLNDWSKKANDGKSISQVMDLSTLQNDVKNAKTDYTFDVWADTGTKLISKVTFTDLSDSSSVFSLSQSYTGSGSSFPFRLDVKTKDSDGAPITAALTETVDTKTNKVSVTFSDATQASDGSTTVSASLNVTPGNNSVTVTAPSGAKSIVDILNELGLGGLTSTSPFVPHSV